MILGKLRPSSNYSNANPKPNPDVTEGSFPQGQFSQISQKLGGCNIYAIMKTMCPPSYHHNGFLVTHALGHMIT